MNRASRHHRLAFAALWAAGVLLGAGPARALDGATTYAFGVIPQFEQRKLHAIWSPIVADLGQRTGLRFELVTTQTIEDFEREFGRGRFDFVYMNPYHALKYPQFVPLVRDVTPLRGILVVQRDGPIRKVEALDGAVVVFPSPNALGASLIMRADLEHLHHLKVKPLYVKTHSSVYLHVVTGLTPAGGGVEKTLSEQPPAIREALRIIYTTRALPPHPVCAHERVPAADQERVRRALLAMDATPEGRARLERIPTTRLVPAARADYEPMRAWGLDAYWVDFWKEEQGR